MTRVLRRAFCCIVIVLCAHAATPAQEAVTAQASTPAQTGVLRVFLDCDYCDETFIRSEITFVDYVRDRTVADVHILATRQSTGGGGSEFTFKFIGLGRFVGSDQTLRHIAPSTSTSDERRRGIAEVLKRGLVRFVAETPLAPRLKITFEGGPATGQTDPAKDPWNLWVYRTSLSGSINGEESSSGRSIRGELSANRTTDAWKLSFGAQGSYRESRFELEDAQRFTSVSRSFNSHARVVKSLTGKWSAAMLGEASVSTFLNHDFQMRIAPGVEYDIFPYAENTRRLLTIQYTAGLSLFDYEEETIFGKTREQLPDHRLGVALNVRQPWGSAEASVQFSQFLSKPDKYSIRSFAFTSVRLFKGFSFDVFGEVSRTRDQLYLQRGAASTEEILVQQRQLATGYQFFLNFGVSYSFGSIFNNVVNPRFGGN